MKRVFVLAALVFASCGQLCQDILRIPVLTFELPEAEATLFDDGPSVVTTCLDDTCWENSTNPSTSRITWNANSRLLAVEQFTGTTVVRGAPSSDVTLTVTRDGGVLFTHHWDDVPFDDGKTPESTCGSLETSEVLRF